ncbi:MAG: hypothetical protein ACW98Y_19725 [Candidatus Thorarchaeota archaeon]|jgi:tetrahydromethanopterin S-methyltransferase subunit H
MFVFKKNQQVYDIGGIPIGGSPGQHPTTLTGGLFFTGQPVVIDTKKGDFDANLASEWISTGNLMIEKTGHPLIIQVYGRTPEAMEQHIRWVIEKFDGPVMFESTNLRARLRGIELCDELGLSNRIVYNSLNLSTTEEELNTLSASSLKTAVVLGWSPRATSLPEKIATIKDAIATAEGAGIEKMLIDPATMPVGAGFGLDYRTLIAIKSEFGLPTCSGSHNAPSAWKFLKDPEIEDESTHLSAIVASTVAAQLFAADSIMYGSMIRTKQVFTAVSLMANAIATSAAESQRALGETNELFDPPTFE